MNSIDLIWLIPLGLLVGVFVNYLADVLPFTRTFSAPVCVHCTKKIPWPTYLALKPCPSCNQKRSLRTGMVLMLCALGLPLLAFFPPTRLPFVFAVPVFVYFLLVAITDMEYRVILNPVSLVGAILGLAVGIALHGVPETLLGGMVGFGIMLAFYGLGILYVRQMAKSRGLSPDEVALGFGDVYLSGTLGMLLGWPGIIAGLFIGVLAGGVFSGLFLAVSSLLRRYKSFQALPYAPFLLLGAAILFFLPR